MGFRWPRLALWAWTTQQTFRRPSESPSSRPPHPATPSLRRFIINTALRPRSWSLRLRDPHVKIELRQQPHPAALPLGMVSLSPKRSS